MFSGPPIPVDSIDAEPSMFRFHRRLASFSRLIRFDQRGEGSSSRAPLDAIGPEYWAQDALSVLNAVGSKHATIFASAYFAASAFVLAAEHPDRVRSIIIVNGAARTLWAPDYPVGARAKSADPFSTVGLEPDAVEKGFDALKAVAPSMAGDNGFRAWWDLAGNRAASPSMARAVLKVLAEADVRDTLEHITAPALIIHRDSSEFVPVGHGRYLAEHIAGSRYVELPGADALYWVGDTSAMLDEIEEFITGVRSGFETARVLTTIVFTDIVGSTERAAALGDERWRDLLDQHDQILRRELARFGGREVNTAGDGFVVTFASPSIAIECAEAIADAVRAIDIEVRVGMHAGEVEVRGSDIAGMAVHIGARVASHAGPGEVLVSSTVREIVTGSHRTFTDRGEYQLKGVSGRWRLHALVRNVRLSQ
ncbi:MAG: adenylate/guanylate cyclase domain-containing protein [Actinomycetia bacterium]|nr:adenylate/guanylate cyclase domain-containing protein [Actinomycetes bacterium]